MKRRIFFYVLMVMLVVSVISPAFDPRKAFAQNIVYQEDFEGNQAQGWELESGWRIIQDGTNHVLAGQGHVWARSNQTIQGDQHLTFRLKLLKGRIHLVICLTEASRYFIGFDGNGSDLSKQFFPDEFQHNLARHEATSSLNHWHQVEIVLKGSTIEFLVDGTRQWSYTDPQALTRGSFAFETLDSSQAYVDDIEVESGTVTSPSAAQPNPPPATAIQSVAANLTWVRTGGPLGGLGYDVRMKPGNPDVMLVTDAWAGIFMSTDGGMNWLPVNTGITTRVGPTNDGIPVFSVTFDPNHPEIVWLGTQNQRGVYKSVDGGHTWEKMDRGIVENVGITFRGFTVQPDNSNVVYAAAEISSWAWAGRSMPGRAFDMTRGVVYKTTDGGGHWTAVWRGDNLARYIWINPQNTNIVYISTGIFDREAANSDPLAGSPGGEGVLKSTDGGVTWTHVNTGLGNLYVGSLFMHPTNPEILLAGTGSNEYHQGAGVYRTTNGGASWSLTLNSQSYNIEAVEFSTSNPSIAYAGNDLAIYRSEDGGETWRRITSRDYWGPPGVCAGFPIDLQVDPRNPDRIFANEYGGGNFVSVDGGRTWMDASRGYTGALMRDLAADPSQPGRVYAAARSGIYVSQDGGYQWEGLSHPPFVANDWTAVAVDPGNPQHLLAFTSWIGLAVSQDSGRSWTLALPNPSERLAIRDIAFSPSDPETVYAGTGGVINVGAWDPSVAAQGILVSHNGGVTWAAANNTLSQDAHVTSLAVSPTKPQLVFAGTTNHGLLRTTNGGGDWTTLQNGLSPGMNILSVAINPIDANTILVGLDRGAVYRSADGGQTWKRSASGLNPEASISDIVFDPTNPQNIYLADIFSGVYRSTNGGSTWMAINNDLLSRSINALAISEDGLHLYAASEGMGVFRMDLNGQPPQQAPTQAVGQATPYAQLGNVTATPASGKMPTFNLPCGGAGALASILLGLFWCRSRLAVVK